MRQIRGVGLKGEILINEEYLSKKIKVTISHEFDSEGFELKDFTGSCANAELTWKQS